jgi:hypothetical protein
MITVDKYTSVELDKYNGIYYLREGYADKDGKFRPNFCRKKFGKGCEEKTAPISVRLGDAGTAAAVLRELYMDITGKAIDDNDPF